MYWFTLVDNANCMGNPVVSNVTDVSSAIEQANVTPNTHLQTFWLAW